MTAQRFQAVGDVVEAVRWSCHRRGSKVAAGDIHAAVSLRLGAAARNAGVEVQTLVRRHVDQATVERIAAALVPREAGSQPHSPPMPTPGTALLRTLLPAAVAAVTSTTTLGEQAARSIVREAVVYGWMEGHIEGEDRCRTPVDQHAELPARLVEPVQGPVVVDDVRELVAGYRGLLTTDGARASRSVPDREPWPHPDSQMLASLVIGACRGVAVPRRPRAVPAVAASTMAAWAAGHQEGHRCSRCRWRGPRTHLRESALLRGRGGGAHQLRQFTGGGAPLLPDEREDPLDRYR